ncbi:MULTISPECIES: DUF642 domain-containing protein [Niveibacterium]|uniref:DUF642 domain-containing protein n=1 Tax=Niveibacterium microcysteis TaxID=2811415 RepID=A0ABX7M9A5_9RHOO|nr:MULTISPECIES: DUF642 domain-containing protein [Niveibacterium]QSI76067.1 DUF642 domain-containing protein [Niveibacterium microcysteis]
MTLTPKQVVRAALVGVATFALIGSAAAAPINLIENGSFEDVKQANGTWSIYTKNFAGWQVNRTYGVELRNNVAGTAFDGVNFVELDTTANSWISQTFDTTVGQTYKVSFYFSPRTGVAADSNDITALINGASALTASGSGVGASGNVWKQYSFNFVAAGDLSTLGFKAGGISNSYGGSLDNVSVTAVPEPASWATMLVGLVGLGAITRRRLS